jgi:hypothetical protein
MAILAIFTGSISKDQYEALRAEINWEAKKPKGGIFHCAGFDEAGHIHVADVWDSPEAMNQFVESELLPAFTKLKFAPPNVEVYPAHNINAYGSIDRFKV